MTRPASHRELPLFPSRCATCEFCVFVQYKGDHLCFHGDEVEIGPPEKFWNTGNIAHSVQLKNGRSVEVMEGEEYSKVWGGRFIDDPDGEVCSEWKRRKTE